MASLQSQQLETITKKVDKKVYFSIQKAKARPKKNHTLYLVAKRALHFFNETSSIPGHVFIGGKKPNGELEAHGFYPDEDYPIHMLYENSNLRRGRNDPEGDDDKLLNAALNGDTSIRYIEFKVTAELYRKAMDYISNYYKHYDYGLFS